MCAYPGISLGPRCHVLMAAVELADIERAFSHPACNLSTNRSASSHTKLGNVETLHRAVMFPLVAKFGEHKRAM